MQFTTALAGGTAPEGVLTVEVGSVLILRSSGNFFSATVTSVTPNDSPANVITYGVSSPTGTIDFTAFSVSYLEIQRKGEVGPTGPTGSSVDLSNPGPIGGTTASTAKFTEISGPGGETQLKFGDYGSWGSLILKGDGTGMSARTLVEFFDAADARIGYIYMEPSTGAMAFMNERNGRLLFGANGADHFVVFPSGGAYLGNSPTDPGNLNLRVQGTVNAGELAFRGVGTGVIYASGTTANNTVFIRVPANGLGVPRILELQGENGANAQSAGFVFRGVSGLFTASSGTTIAARNSANSADVVFTGLDLIGTRSLRATPTTLASLPTAATVGDGSFANITDGATATVGAVATGSGSYKQTLRSDGTDWRVLYSQ
jgi:hypothetical protein